MENEFYSMKDSSIVSFALPKVQPFIAAARTTRDLYCGSFILSWLTLTAMQPVLNHCGATLLSPSLKNIPKDVQKQPFRLASPCLPSTFLAVAPAKDAEALARECCDALLEAWLDLAEKVRLRLSKNRLAAEYPEWDKRWDQQVKNAFFPVTAVLPVESFVSEGSGNAPWQTQQGDIAVLDASDWLMQCRRRIADIPCNRPTEPGERFPLKCSLLGTVEQMGPDAFENSAHFWKLAREQWQIKGVRLRKGERLSAVPLVKRYGWIELMGEHRPGFPDTATVAARCWLQDVGLDAYAQNSPWSGQWLHWSTPNQEEDEVAAPEDIWEALESIRKNPNTSKPPLYYAVLQGDGDCMSRWLRGDFHTDGSVGVLAARAEISAALNDFAINHVPQIVKNHGGECVYAGGDDVLALTPLAHAFGCARELQRAFHRCMASAGGTREATFSMGLVAVHYKSDLRRVLEAVRRTEKEAKAWGRDILMVRVCPRSGGHLSMMCPWDMTTVMEKLVSAFIEGASDSFVRKFGTQSGLLDGLGSEAVLSEAVRIFARGEEESRRLLTEALGGSSPSDADVQRDVLRTFLEKYLEEIGRRREPPGALRCPLTERISAVWKTASFFARGRDR